MSYINAEEERKANKFKNILGKTSSNSSHYYDPYKTDRGYSTGILQNPEEYQKAMTLRNSFENSATKIMKRQLASQKVKPPLINSESRTTFQNLRAVREEINKYVPDDFRAAFDEIAISGVIKTGDIVTIVRSVMGDEAPLWVVNKFVSLGQEVAKFKTITWNKFRHIVERVQDVANFECSQGGANIPDWIKADGSSPTSGLVAYKHKSSYMTDFNEERLIDYESMRLDASKTGTTRDLFLGTTKATYQLSGYGGHIPVNTNNAKKELHSKGTSARPQPCYLRLVSERLGSIPSYTGYIPKMTGLNGERKTGMNPLTTTGAAYGI